MSSKYRDDFFSAKRHWSAYKDSVLSYYLTPYLQKVKKIGKPILIVDMFAGQGKFSSGEPGSPIIMADLISKANVDVPVELLCFEEHPPFATRLQAELKPYPFARVVGGDCFAHIDSIASEASKKTVFLYVDPCEPTRVHLNQIDKVCEHVRRSKASVEVLIVLMARAFMRAARMVVKNEDELLPLSDKLIVESERQEDKEMWLHAIYGGEDVVGVERQWKMERALDAIAGGAYWRSIAEAPATEWLERCWKFVEQYQDQLRKWFSVVESYPIHSDSGEAIPKYWLVFGSRYEPAFDLFNRAACAAKRTQKNNYRKPGSLFEGVPIEPESIPRSTVDRAVTATSAIAIPCSWKALRWRCCSGRDVGRFTDSEVDQAIKRLLKSGRLVGAGGAKVDDNAVLRHAGS